MIGAQSHDYDYHSTQREPFLLETFHEKVVCWVTVDDQVSFCLLDSGMTWSHFSAIQSINVVGCPELRELLLYIGHDIQDKDIPHRTKLMELILKQYEIHWHEMTCEMKVNPFPSMEFLTRNMSVKASLGQISFTSDMWTNGILKGFMAITAHYMMKDAAGHLTMKSCLIAFRQVWGSHDGPNMAKSFLSVLEELGISDRVCVSCISLSLHLITGIDWPNHTRQCIQQ